MSVITLIGPDDDLARSAEKAVAAGDFEIRRIRSADDLFAPGTEESTDMVGFVFSGEDAGVWERILTVSRRLAHTNIPLVAFADAIDVKDRVRLLELGVKDCFSTQIHPGELNARLQTLLATKVTMDSLRDEKMKAILRTRQLQDRVADIDRQMRLARRLQQDFLPRVLPELPGVRFAARLEPAGWVAGDFYDIFRLDEQHVGFYVADVVGHGIAAALLTVFVKKSLQTKRIHADRYELVMPDEALRLLNLELISANLEAASYITLVYGVYDAAERRIQYARAGHPRPMLIHADGGLEYLDADGPLLGIFAEASFQLREVRLAAGDRVVLYTDGVEKCRIDDLTNIAAFEAVASRSVRLPPEQAVDEMLDAVQHSSDPNIPEDDVTLVVLAAE